MGMPIIPDIKPKIEISFEETINYCLHPLLLKNLVLLIL